MLLGGRLARGPRGRGAPSRPRRRYRLLLAASGSSAARREARRVVARSRQRDATAAGGVRLASVTLLAAATIASPTFLIFVVAEPGRREELLGAALGTAENRSGLRARPFESLLDLGPRGVRQLGRLVARLFEEPAALGLCLAELLGRIAVGIRKQLTRLVARVVAASPRAGVHSPGGSARSPASRSCCSRRRRRTSSSVLDSWASEAFCASASIVSANSEAARIRCRESMRTA